MRRPSFPVQKAKERVFVTTPALTQPGVVKDKLKKRKVQQEAFEKETDGVGYVGRGTFIDRRVVGPRYIRLEMQPTGKEVATRF